MESIDGFVLVGGRSSRMGRDKSALTISGQTFVERAAAALRGVCDTIRVVGGDSESPSGLYRVSDVYPDWGALGGLQAALVNSGAQWTAILACDLPFVTAKLFQRLASLRDDFDAVAPIQSDGFAQPLCALYRVATCRARATEMIESGERRPIALLQSVRTRWVDFNEISDLNGSSYFFDNINTPEDYARVAPEGGQTH